MVTECQRTHREPPRLPRGQYGQWQIKVALQLPYVDHACHRFVARGITYVVSEHMISEQEIIWENDRNPGRYRCSEKISIERVFTTLGSSIKYYQDTWYVGTYDIRCTLLKRVA